MMHTLGRKFTKLVETSVNRPSAAAAGEATSANIDGRSVTPAAVARNGAALAVAVLLAWAVIGRGSFLLQSALVVAITYAMLAMGSNVIFGWSGLFPFGQAAVFGAGAYATALVGPHVGSALAMLAVAGVTGCAVQLIMMSAFGRFASISFGMLTLVASEVAYQYVSTANSLGAVNSGIFGVPRGSLLGLNLISQSSFWWYALAILAICTAAYLWLKRTMFALWLNAVRDDAGRVDTLRRSTYALRCYSSLPAGALCGIGGGLYVQYSGAATPYVLDFSISGIALFMCLLGGRDSPLGPLVGAFIYCIVTQYFLYGNSYPDIFTGLALMVVVVLLPAGLLSIRAVVTGSTPWAARRGAKTSDG
jgi:branched-chain amino acid transport system permease protein